MTTITYLSVMAHLPFHSVSPNGVTSPNFYESQLRGGEKKNTSIVRITLYRLFPSRELRQLSDQLIFYKLTTQERASLARPSDGLT